MTEPVRRYPLRTRILHWLVAILIFSMLFIGFVMVTWLGSYSALVGIHMTLGVVVLCIVVLRIANRFTHRAPKLPNTVGWAEHKLVVGSELTLYALMLAQPLIGWAMVSAGGRPPVIFGSVRLPRDRTVQRRSVLRAPSDPLGVGVCIGRRHRRAYQRGTASHADTARPHAVADGVLAGPLDWRQAVLGRSAARFCDSAHAGAAAMALCNAWPHRPASNTRRHGWSCRDR